MSPPSDPGRPGGGPSFVPDDPPGTETYRVVRHEAGYAYAARGTLSETFATRGWAVDAARRAAAAQMASGRDAQIVYETSDGVWLTERAEGCDRPVTGVGP